MNELMKSALETQAPCGSAVLWWLGQMGLMVRLGKTLLCLDYFATETPARQTPPPVPAGEVTGICAFLGTHDHNDHMDRAAWRVWAKTCPDAVFVFPRAHLASVAADCVESVRCLGLNGGESVSIGNVRITAVAAAHEFLAQDPQTGLYPCLQYIIEGNGFRLYHAGDTLRYEGMLPILKSFGPIDAALLPINGRDAEHYRRNCIGNMTFQEAVDLAGELDVRTVIPGHWDMFKDNSGDPWAFRAYLEAKYPQGPSCVVPERGKCIVLRSK